MTEILLQLRIAARQLPLPTIRRRAMDTWRINSRGPMLSFGDSLYHTSASLSIPECSTHAASERNEQRTHHPPTQRPAGEFDAEALIDDVHSRMRKALYTGALNYIKGGTVYKRLNEEAGRLDAHGVPYSPETYDLLLSACAKVDDYAQALQLLNDMKDQGIRPTKRFFDKSLHLVARFGLTRLFRRITVSMAYYGYSTQTPAVYTEWVKCLCNNTELEHAIDVIDKMKREDIRPSLHTYMPVIHAAIGLGHPDVALQYFEEGKETYLRLSRGAEDLPEHLRPLIVRVLRCAAYAGSYEIVKTTWDLAVNKQKYMPDEGLCYYVLNVAAQQGDPTLGLDVIRTIGAQGLPYKEAHFSALVEAYAATEDWKSTLRIFHVMRKAGVIPRRNTAQSMLAKFAMDPEAVHAARNALRKLSEEKQADVVAFNLLIHSYANNGDYDSAMGLFDTLKEQNIAFDSDTVDSLLDACIHAKRYDEGAAIYRKYVDGEHIKATPRTLSKMVALACTQDDYEDAFTYLEETKAMKMVPLRGTYYRLIKKLASCNDTRLESAIQEMKACGYEISTFMREHLEKHSKQESEEEASTSTPAVASNGL